MTREELVRLREKSWARLAELLEKAEGTAGIRRLGPEGIAELAMHYRTLAGDLMRARRDRLGADLERHLDSLAARAHNSLYAGSTVGNRASFTSLFHDFPGAVRRNFRFFLLATVLFYAPLFIAGAASYSSETYALAVLSDAQLEAMERMHSRGHAEGRASDLDAQMTGFYVFNNVGIAFRCFATGILLGLGPVFYLLFNGLMIGVVFGHLSRNGLSENIFSFVSSHSPWELTAIVISGAAGMQMGAALISTQGRTRISNLQAHGLELLRQVAGAAAFLAIAAVLEAWYSPSSLPVGVKYLTGIFGWIFVFGLLAYGGRSRTTPEDVQTLRGRSR